MNEDQVAAAKRKFLGYAFHPNGWTVATSMGMVPESVEVARTRVGDECSYIASTRPLQFNIMTMASWYIDALDATEAPDDVPLSDHLYAFAVGLLLSDVENLEREIIP